MDTVTATLVVATPDGDNVVLDLLTDEDALTLAVAVPPTSWYEEAVRRMLLRWALEGRRVELTYLGAVRPRVLAVSDATTVMLDVAALPAR